MRPSLSASKSNLTAPVMAAAGITAADWFKIRLGVKSQKKEVKC
jgi:hypothetical protein